MIVRGYRYRGWGHKEVEESLENCFFVYVIDVMEGKK